MTKKILLVDDELDLLNEIVDLLKPQGFEVLTARSGEEAIKVFDFTTPDLILLDMQLPDKNGFDICREIRSFSNVPIMIMSASGQLVDKVLGLELGADDYIQKPFDLKELIARIRAHFRRYNSLNNNDSNEAEILRSESLVINVARSTVELSGVELQLTKMEYQVLTLLMKNAGVTFSREQLVEEIRGMEWDSVDRTVDVIISRLRTKLQDDAKNPKYLRTIWGSGYRFVGKLL